MYANKDTGHMFIGSCNGNVGIPIEFSSDFHHRQCDPHYAVRVAGRWANGSRMKDIACQGHSIVFLDNYTFDLVVLVECGVNSLATLLKLAFRTTLNRAALICMLPPRKGGKVTDSHDLHQFIVAYLY